MFFRQWLLLFFIIFIPHFSQGQKVTVNAYIDSTDYLIGQHIPLHIEIHHPPGIQVTWKLSDAPPAPFLLPENGFTSSGSWLSKHFQKVKLSAIDTVKDNIEFIERRTIFLTSFDTGQLQIPTLAWYYFDEGKHFDSVATPPISVSISTIAVDTAKGMRSLKPLLVTKQKSYTAWWFLIIPGALIIIVLSYFLFRKRKRPVQIYSLTVANHPFETAIKELQQLEEEKIWEQHPQEFYVRITNTMRDYMQKHMKIPASEITSRKIIKQLEKKIPNAPVLKHLYRDLIIAENVKFANLKPSDEDCLSILYTFKDFLQQTNN